MIDLVDEMEASRALSDRMKQLAQPQRAGSASVGDASWADRGRAVPKPLTGLLVYNIGSYAVDQYGS